MKAHVALIAMSGHGHVKRALVMAQELVSAGAIVRFFTSPRCAEGVRCTGSLFYDLFKRSAFLSYGKAPETYDGSTAKSVLIMAINYADCANFFD